MESKIPEPDLSFVALTLLSAIGALVPIGLLAATVIWGVSSSHPARRIGRLLWLWLSGLAAVALARLGWVALISETSERFSALSLSLLFPFLAVTAGFALLLLKLTRRWFGGKAPSQGGR